MSVAQAIFASILTTGLRGLNLPAAETAAALHGGVHEVAKHFGDSEVTDAVLGVVNKAISRAFFLPPALGCASLLAALVTVLYRGAAADS